MDPLSIVAGSVGLADICVRFVQYVRKYRNDTVIINDQITSLVREVEALQDVCFLVKETFSSYGNSDMESSNSNLLGSSSSPVGLWKRLERSLENCQILLEKLEQLVSEVCGDSQRDPSSRRALLGKVHRKRSREDELLHYQKELSTYKSAIALLLTSITYQDARLSRNHSARSFHDLSASLEGFDKGIKSRIDSLQQSIDTADSRYYDAAALAALKELQASVASAAESLMLESKNEFFYIPQSVSSIFTGRNLLLNELRDIFIQPPGGLRYQRQRRFVIHGLGGSGKTQFCCKFAEDNRHRFWGVFWVDASTPDRIEQTLGDIAALAGRERNTTAALHWLANLEKRWLLIIDNADDASISLEKLFPKGNGGHILVTTRNPAYKLHGNVGPGYYDFAGLDSNEATDLLLKASGQPMPWDMTCEQLAHAITEALGLLALAIVHAGAAIRDGLCGLKDFLAFYSRSWQKVRTEAMAAKSSGNEVIVFATWELCYEQLEQRNTEATLDAIQLLKTFAFFHSENISRDILSRALRNGDLERQQEQKDAQQERLDAQSHKPTWDEWFRSTGMLFVAYLMKNRGPAPLPAVIRDGRITGRIDISEDRIRYALKELRQMALVNHNIINDTYTMHPIVHQWARERPKMKLADQILWADIAGMVLSSSILLPPLGLSAEDDRYHVSILSHIEHVQKCRDAAQQRLRLKEADSWTSWLFSGSTVDPDKLRMKAKFGSIYARCGQWAQAETLLKDVYSYLCRLLGPDHKRSRQVALALSGIYWQMSQSTEAIKLQTSVLNTCRASLGIHHPETFRVMGQLGRTRWLQGQYTVARKLQEQALEGLQKALGPNDPDTLHIMDDYARTIAKFWNQKDFEESHQLHLTVIERMEKIHGPEHERTLFAKESCSRVAVLLGGQHLEKALEMIDEVRTTRATKLGKENPFTLLAVANSAIVKCALGSWNEAEDIARKAMAIAERNLDPKHIGILFGRHTLACILVQQRCLTEAESILIQVLECQKEMDSRRGDYHPDRLGTLIELARCYQMQGMLDKSIEVCNEAIIGFESITVSEHPLATATKLARQDMLAFQAAHPRNGHEQTYVAENQLPAVLFKIPAHLI